MDKKLFSPDRMAGPQDDPEARSWRPRAGTADDLPGLVSLFNTVFEKTAPEEQLHWKYRANPHGTATTWVAEDSGAGIVGAYSYVPRRLWAIDEDAVGRQASDAMVLPEFQRQGIFVRLDQEVSRDRGVRHDAVAFAFEGRRSVRGFRRASWKPIGEVVRYRCFVTGAARAGEKPWIGGVARALLRPLESSQRDRILRRCHEGMTGFDVERVATCGPEFDALWQRAREGLGRIAGVRDAAWLQWRYLETPARRHTLLAVRGGGALVGYVVVEAARTASGVEGFLVDALAERTELAEAVLAAGFAELVARGASVVHLGVLEGHPYLSAARALGFRPPTRPRPYGNTQPFIVKPLRVGAKTKRFLESEHWFVMEGDRDDEFVSRGEPA